MKPILAPTLSPQERRIVERRRNGMQWKEISDDLGITIYTAKSYMQRIVFKCGARSIRGALNLLGPDETAGFAVKIIHLKPRPRAQQQEFRLMPRA